LYLCAFGEAAELAGLGLAERLRDAIPGLRLLVNSGGGSFKSQMKKADKSGALFALLLGESEIEAGQVAVKDLRGGMEQQTIDQASLVQWLTDNLS
ncbi:MAG: His/Gly/Thr/Pro-type tRNA ligase C-terminal domain-containing protein, partial [Thalassolituus sp.]